MDTQQQRWVSVAEAARALGKAERTVRRWVSAGKIASDRTGPGLRVDIGGLLPAHAGTVPAVLTELDLAHAELERLREALDDTRAERDYLREALQRAQAVALAVAGERPQLTVGERRRWWWPWERRD